MNPEHDENPTNRATQNGKAKSAKSQLVGPHRPSRSCRWPRLRGLAVCHATGSAAMPTQGPQEAEEAPPRLEPRRIPQVL